MTFIFLKTSDIKEFNLVHPDSAIYKSMGPVLVKQDRQEAIGNVNKRIEFIKSEIKRIETQLKELSEKQETKKLEIVKLQTMLQQQQQQQQQPELQGEKGLVAV